MCFYTLYKAINIGFSVFLKLRILGVGNYSRIDTINEIQPIFLISYANFKTHFLLTDKSR